VAHEVPFEELVLGLYPKASLSGLSLLTEEFGTIRGWPEKRQLRRLIIPVIHILSLSLEEGSYQWVGMVPFRIQGEKRQASARDRKIPITATDLLNDRVVPFFNSHDVKLQHLLTDRAANIATIRNEMNMFCFV